MKKLVLILLLLSMIASLPVGGHFTSASGNPWTSRTPIPTPLAGLEAAVANGKIYAFRMSVTYEYNPGAVWATKSSMPTWRYNAAVASYQNMIYVVGGVTNDTIITEKNEVYNPENDSWKTMAPMPTPRHSLDANVVDGKIYLIGGLVQHHLFPDVKGTYEATDANEVYDPTTNSWTARKTMPNATYNYASAVVDNKIYIISETLTQIYNPEDDAWSYGTPPPHSVDMAGSAATTGATAPPRIYVIGGREGGLEVNCNQIYDPATDSWSLGTPLPTGRYSLGVAAVNDVIYAFGGMTGAFVAVEQQDQNEQYNPFEDTTIPAPSHTGTPTPLVSPSPSPSTLPSSSPLPTPSPPASPTPSTSASEQPTQTPPEAAFLPAEAIYAAAAAAAITVAGATVILKRKKGKHKMP